MRRRTFITGLGSAAVGYTRGNGAWTQQGGNLGTQLSDRIADVIHNT
jgi:hypothetical protein